MAGPRSDASSWRWPDGATGLSDRVRASRWTRCAGVRGPSGGARRAGPGRGGDAGTRPVQDERDRIGRPRKSVRRRGAAIDVTHRPARGEVMRQTQTPNRGNRRPNEIDAGSRPLGEPRNTGRRFSRSRSDCRLLRRNESRNADESEQVLSGSRTGGTRILLRNEPCGDQRHAVLYVSRFHVQREPVRNLNFSFAYPHLADPACVHPLTGSRHGHPRRDR